MLAMVFSLGVSATELTWTQPLYSHYANEEPIQDVFKNMLAAESIPVVISDKVEGKISARFDREPVEQVFKKLIQIYNLTWYYDGRSLYLYSNDEISTAMVRLHRISVDEFTQSLNDLDILESRFQWRTAETDGLIFFSGPARYVSLVEEMVKVLDKKQDQYKVYQWQGPDGDISFSTQRPKLSQQQSLNVLRFTANGVEKTTIDTQNVSIFANKESKL